MKLPYIPETKIIGELTEEITTILQKNHIEVDSPPSDLYEELKDYFDGFEELYRKALEDIAAFYDIEHAIPTGEEFETLPRFFDLLYFVYSQRYPRMNKWNRFVDKIGGKIDIKRQLKGRQKK